MNTNSIIKVYDKIAEKYAKSFKEEPEETKIILEFIEMLPKNAKVLDVGCGNSDYFDLFKKHNINYVGIDLSKEMIKTAKKLHPQGEFFVKDMRKLDFKDASFDGIFGFFSLIHIPKKETDDILARFNKLLKSNGKIILALQEGEGETFMNTPFLPESKLFLALFKESEIKENLEKSGFKIIKIVQRPPRTPNQLRFNKLYVLASK